MPLLFALIALTFLPGLPLAAVLIRHVRTGLGWFAIAGTLGMLWSVAATLGLTILHAPLTAVIVVTANTLPLLLVLFHPAVRLRTHMRLREVSFPPTSALIVLLTAAALAFPLLTVQRGLPTGDVQKSIFWAQRVLATRALPDYREALAINRDPADFAVPGLHTLTAALVSMSTDPFGSPAWFSLLATLLLAGLAAALAGQLARAGTALPPLAFLFAATNIRFLRYALAPGYHYQNLIGELFLFASFLCLITAVDRRGGARFIGLGAVFAVALPFVHQFSAFVGLLTLPVFFFILALRFHREIAAIVSHRTPKRRRAFLTASLLVLAAILTALLTGLVRGKLPHLFTAAPHLRAFVVPLASIPKLLGPSFTLLGIVGVLIISLRLWRHALARRWALLLLWMGLLLALSQGARAFIDIPSARTLFYLTTPLAIAAALGVSGALARLRAAWPRSSAFLVPVALGLILAPTAGSALNDGLQKIDHGAQANATLTPATLDLLKWLKQHPPSCPSSAGQEPSPRCSNAILIDDWNRRRSTWTILSPYRMLTRVGADLAVIAREAEQSEQRRTQYETLLDFEKIYDLGNSTIILPLLEHHGIAFVVGVRDLSTDVFAYNPALTKVYENEEVALFAARPYATDPTLDTFDHATLVNDIGDAEDVFAHLPLSVLAPQISHVITTPERTFREVKSAVSSIGLNIHAYVPSFWDADDNHVVDRTVELSLRVLGNGARGRVTRGTTVYATFDLPKDSTVQTIRATVPAGDLPIDDQGLAFLTIRLDQGPLQLDRAAARLLTSAAP